MPLDPALSTHILVPQPSQNPLGMVGEFANIQNALNQNRLFQQTFAARQRAGQILSSAPDIETGIQGLMRDPLVAPFAGAIINPIREGQQTLLSMQGMQQTQANSALETFWKSAGAAMQNPDRLPDIIKTTLATLPPGATVGPQVGQALGDIARTLTDPSIGPNGETIPMTRDKYQAILAGLMVNHSTPDAIRALTGQVAPQPMTVEGPSGEKIPGVLGGPLGGQTVFTPLSNQLAAGPLRGQPFSGLGAVQPVDSRGRPLTASSSPEDLGTGLARLAPSPAGLVGPTAEREGMLDYMAKNYEPQLAENVRNATQFSRNMQEVLDAAKSAQLGGGAEAYAKLGKLMQALGVNNSVVDKWANGNLAATQVVDKVTLDNTLLRLRQLIPGSRMNMQEFIQGINRFPNSTTDPRAVIEIFRLWQSFNNMYRTEQSALDSYKSAGGDPTRWPALWQRSPYMLGFAPMGEFSTAGVRGAEGAPMMSPIRPEPAAPARPGLGDIFGPNALTPGR